MAVAPLPDNKGDEGALWDADATPRGDRHVAAEPDSTSIEVGGIFDAAVATSPRSAGVLLDPITSWAAADRVAATSWNSVAGSPTANNMTYVSAPANATDDHVYTTGADNLYLSIPDSAALDLDGSATVEIVMRLGIDWKQSNYQVLLAKGSAYEVGIGDPGLADANIGKLYFRVADGSTNPTRCQATLPFRNGENGWIKITWHPTTHEIHYYVAEDATAEPGTWHEIGWQYLTVYQYLDTTITGNSDVVSVGYRPGVSGTGITGRIYNVIIRDGIGGTEVLDIDVPTDTSGSASSFTATSGQTVTLTGHPTIDIITANATLPVPYYNAAWNAAYDWSPVGSDEVWMYTLEFTVTTWPTSDYLHLLSINGVPDSQNQGIEFMLDTSTQQVLWGGVGFNQGNYFLSSVLPASGNFIIVAFLNLTYSPDTYAQLVVRVFDDAGVAYGGGAYTLYLNDQGVWSHDIRVSEYDGSAGGIAINITDLSIQEPTPIVPSAWSIQTADWDNTAEDYARALAGLAAFYDEGDTFIVNGAGDAAWAAGVSAFVDGDLIIQTAVGTDIVEGSTTWAKRTLSGNNPVWYTMGEGLAEIQEGFTVEENEDLFIFAVFSSGRLSGTDVFYVYDDTTGCYIDMWVNVNPSSPDVYVDVNDVDSNNQYGDAIPSPANWTLGAGSPVMCALWLQRTDAGSNLWAYMDDAGLVQAQDGSDVLSRLDFSNAAIDASSSPLTWGGPNYGSAIWGYGWDIRPRIPVTQQYMTDLKSSIVNRSY